MKKIIPLVLIVWAAVLPDAYADDMASVSCKEDGNQAEMTACSIQDRDAADVKLNATYRQKMAALDKAGQEALRRDERAWLKTIEKDCNKEADDEAEGGTMRTMLFNECLAGSKTKRTLELGK